MNCVPIPSANTSDVDKVQVKIFSHYFKLLLSIAEVDSSILCSQNNLPIFNDVINFLANHFERNIDKSTKKGISAIFRELFIDFSGLTNQPKTITQYTRRANTD
jgi:hypothetical protein